MSCRPTASLHGSSSVVEVSTGPDTRSADRHPAFGISPQAPPRDQNAVYWARSGPGWGNPGLVACHTSWWPCGTIGAVSLLALRAALPSFPLPAWDQPPRERRERGSHDRRHGAPSAQPGNSLYAALSPSDRQMLREYTGRGPTKARTTIRDNVVVVMLEQTLDEGEQVLVKKGRGRNVLRCAANIKKRCATKAAPSSPSSPANTSSRYDANHLDPDLAAESTSWTDRPPSSQHPPARPPPSQRSPTQTPTNSLSVS